MFDRDPDGSLRINLDKLNARLGSMDGYSIVSMLIFSSCMGIVIELLKDDDLKNGHCFSLLTLWIFASAASSSLYTSIFFTLNSLYPKRAYSCGSYDWIQNTCFSDEILMDTRKKAFIYFQYSVKWFSLYLVLAPLSKTFVFEFIEKNIFETFEMLLKHFGSEKDTITLGPIFLEIVLLSLVYYNSRIYYSFFSDLQYFIDVARRIDRRWSPNNGNGRWSRNNGNGGDDGDDDGGGDSGSGSTSSGKKASKSSRTPSHRKRKST